MTRKNISQKGSFYICYKCLSFKTNNKNDMQRHFERTTSCTSSIISSTENYYNLSMSHRFISEIDLNSLKIEHLQQIISHFINSFNVITFDNLNSILDQKIIKND